MPQCRRGDMSLIEFVYGNSCHTSRSPCTTLLCCLFRSLPDPNSNTLSWWKSSLWQAHHPDIRMPPSHKCLGMPATKFWGWHSELLYILRQSSFNVMFDNLDCSRKQRRYSGIMKLLWDIYVKLYRCNKNLQTPQMRSYAWSSYKVI